LINDLSGREAESMVGAYGNYANQSLDIQKMLSQLGLSRAELGNTVTQEGINNTMAANNQAETFGKNSIDYRNYDRSLADAAALGAKKADSEKPNLFNQIIGGISAVGGLAGGVGGLMGGLSKFSNPGVPMYA
jgi:hypothetical protein